MKRIRPTLQQVLPGSRWHRRGRLDYVVQIDWIREWIVAFSTVPLKVRYERNVAWFLDRYLPDEGSSNGHIPTT